MQPETILKSDVLDILFENRNKEYGAYTLRREYDIRLGKAIAITFSLAALLLLLSYSSKKKENAARPYVISDISPMSHPPKDLKKQPEAPKKAAAVLPKKSVQTPVASVQDTRAIVVQDQDATKNIPTTADILKKNVSNINTDGASTNSLQNVVATANDGKGKSGGDAPPQIDASAPINNPDVYPDFPGGKTALLNFLRKNLTNPRDLDDEEMISVRIRFVVNADGTISDFDIVQSGGSEFDAEVLRVLKKMPHWKPGKSNGHDVSVYYEVPVKFIAAGG